MLINTSRLSPKSSYCEDDLEKIEKVQLKEFSLINPKLEAREVFQAIQTACAPDTYAQVLEKSNSFEKRQRKLPASLVVCDRNCHEFLVIRFNGDGTKKSS